MFTKRAAETRTFAVDFSRRLQAREMLTGTPTIAEIGSADLTFGSLILIDPRPAPGWWIWPAWLMWSSCNRSVLFQVSGGTAGHTYTVRITAATDADSSQSLIMDVQLRVN